MPHTVVVRTHLASHVPHPQPHPQPQSHCPPRVPHGLCTPLHPHRTAAHLCRRTSLKVCDTRKDYNITRDASYLAYAQCRRRLPPQRQPTCARSLHLPMQVRSSRLHSSSAVPPTPHTPPSRAGLTVRDPHRRSRRTRALVCARAGDLVVALPGCGSDSYRNHRWPLLAIGRLT